MTAPTTPLPDRVTTWICAECIPDGVPALDPPAASFSLPCCVCGALHRPPMIRRVAVVDLRDAWLLQGAAVPIAIVNREHTLNFDAGKEPDPPP